jgi:hypothetical protein
MVTRAIIRGKYSAMAMPTLSPLGLWVRVKVVIFCVLLLGALGWQRSCNAQQPLAPPAFYIHAAPVEAGAAVVPVAYRIPAPSRRWFINADLYRFADTARLGGAAHLACKASPRNRWLPAQPAYFRSLPRRPPQRVLDSLARASMRQL